MADRLEVQETSWNNTANEWTIANKEESFKLQVKPKIIIDHLGVPYNNKAASRSGRDKSSFTSLLPKDDL